MSVLKATFQQNRALETFEKRRDEMHLEELQLEKRADDAVTALATSTQMILGLSSGSNMIVQGSFPCSGGGAGFVFTSMLSFSIGFSLAIVVAFKKLNRLSQPVQDLRDRQTRLHMDILEFKANMGLTGDRATICVPATETDSESDPGMIVSSVFMQSSFTRRLNAVLNSVSNLSNFWRHYKSMVVWVAIGAIVHGISNPIMAYYMFCKRQDGSSVRKVSSGKDT